MAATSGVQVQGEWDPRFEGAVDAFRNNFTERGELGGALAVMQDGVPVVDIWGGHRDVRRTRPWERDTLVAVASTTKGLTSLCAHILADRGELDFDAPVAKYWPEFGAAGKDAIPYRWVLSHKSGLAGTRQPVTAQDFCDWQRMCGLLEEMEPWWEPGTEYSYHATTFGWLVGEPIRRITGTSFGSFFQREVAGPLGLDFYIGLPQSEDARTAEVHMEVPLTQLSPEDVAAIPEVVLRSLDGAPSPADLLTRQWRGAEIPAANGHGTARAVARVYAALVAGGTLDGVCILSKEETERCREGQGVMPDLFGRSLFLKLQETEWGLGYALNRLGIYGPNPKTFGHTGAGGSFGFADPENGLAVAYVTNLWNLGTANPVDPRGEAVVQGIYAAL